MQIVRVKKMMDASERRKWKRRGGDHALNVAVVANMLCGCTSGATDWYPCPKPVYMDCMWCLRNGECADGLPACAKTDDDGGGA